MSEIPDDIRKVSENCVASTPLSTKWKTLLSNRIAVSLTDERERCANLANSVATDVRNSGEQRITASKICASILSRSQAPSDHTDTNTGAKG